MPVLTQCHLWYLLCGPSPVCNGTWMGFQMHNICGTVSHLRCHDCCERTCTRPCHHFGCPKRALLLYQPESLMTSLRRCISGQDSGRLLCRILLGHHRLYQDL